MDFVLKSYLHFYVTMWCFFSCQIEYLNIDCLEVDVPNFIFVCLSRCGLSILEKTFIYFNFLVVVRLQSNFFLFLNTPSPNPIVKAKKSFLFQINFGLESVEQVFMEGVYF